MTDKKQSNINIRINADYGKRLDDVYPDLVDMSRNKKVEHALDDLVTLKGDYMEYAKLIEYLKSENVDCEAAIKQVKKLNKTPKYERGINEVKYKEFKEFILNYNKECANEYKVHISLKLFLDLIGGNVNSISKLYTADKETFDTANKENGTDANTNRALSIYLKRETGESIKIADYLKGKFNESIVA